MLKNTIRLALAVGCFLLIPLAAKLNSDDFAWSPFDFVAAGIVLFGTGFMYLLLTRTAESVIYRVATGMALVSGLLLLWINAAVGIIGGEDDPANVMYLGVLGIGFLGGLVAQFRPLGMARTLFAMAVALGVVEVIALILLSGRPIIESIRTSGVNGFFIVMFSGAAILYLRAAEGRVEPRAA